MDCRPLRDLAAVLEQSDRRQRVFDALSDSRHPQHVSEVDDRTNDRGGARVDEHRRNKLSVELHFVYRQVTQVPERRIAAAEVVDRDANTALSQPI